jgi:hypothetical protein
MHLLSFKPNHQSEELKEKKLKQRSYERNFTRQRIINRKVSAA